MKPLLLVYKKISEINSEENWIRLCKHPFSSWILAILSFSESCIFFIPPEVMLMPMCYFNKTRVLWLAFITTIASVLGAIGGYAVGSLFWQELGPYFVNNIPNFSYYFEKVGQLYGENAFSALILAAVTPIPFKVFTVAAGVYSSQVSLGLLIITSLVGRGFRYFLLAYSVSLFKNYTPAIIRRYFFVGGLIALLLFVLFNISLD